MKVLKINLQFILYTDLLGTMDDFSMNPNRHWWHLHCWLWKDSFPSGFVHGHRKWDEGIRRKNGLTPHYMNESCWKTLDQTGSRYRNLSIDAGNNGCPNSIPGKEYVALCLETYMYTNLSKILLQFNNVFYMEFEITRVKVKQINLSCQWT